MTREEQNIIDDMRNIVKPIIAKMLLETNFEGCGKEDKAEFETEFEKILTLAEKALEQELRWIPTSERYPRPDDEYKFFLVTDDKGRVSVQEFYISLDEEPQPYFSGMTNVVAWMPLPNAYREVGE